MLECRIKLSSLSESHKKHILRIASLFEPHLSVILKDRSGEHLSLFISKSKDLMLLNNHLGEIKEVSVPRLIKHSSASQNRPWSKLQSPVTFKDGYTVYPGKGKGRGKRLYIECQKAFGLGNHPSTYLSLLLIRDIKNKFETFLDCGCGTGVLMIFAKKYGALNVTGIDIDPESIKASRFNLKQNGVKGRIIAAGLKEAGIKKVFDAVAVNMNTSILEENLESITNRVAAGGFLILSGMADDNWRSVKRSVLKSGDLTFIKRRRKKEWTALLFKNNKKYV